MSEVPSVVAAVGSVIAATVGIIGLYYTIKKEKPHFALYAVRTGHPPNREPHSIIISNPTKPIDKCMVFCNGKPLESLGGVATKNWRYIDVGGSATFILPDNFRDSNAKIVVKDGKKTLQKIQLKDMPYSI